MGITEFYQAILDTLPQLVLVIRPIKNQKTKADDFLIEYVNKAWESIVESSESSIETHALPVLQKLFSETIFADSNVPWFELFTKAKQSNSLTQKTFIDSIKKWFEITVTMLNTDLICLTLADITDLKQKELHLLEQNNKLSLLSEELAESKDTLRQKINTIEELNTDLQHIAFFDKLTGLPNRSNFVKKIHTTYFQSEQKNPKFALAILDVDNLKTLNDTLSHDHGDILLVHMAQRLEKLSKFGIQTSRFGGDEFLLLIPQYQNVDELVFIINEIRKNLCEPYFLMESPIISSVSIGIAMYPDDASSLQELLKNADIALSDAKLNGKNSYSLFHSLMQEKLLSQTAIEQKMHNALKKNSFHLFFQPQYDVNNKHLRGFEALIRWFDPDLGYISPDRFIAIAEENKLIIPIGEWVIKKACQTISQWKKSFGFNGIMSINVSPIQLQAEGFIQKLKKVLKETEIEAQSLEIEITESVVLRNLDKTIPLLNEIKNLGIGISLDDFGTGYSSLSYLQNLPISTLKIDKSFISNISQAESIEYDITDAIMTLVAKQGISTIAEGVETTEQYEIMKKLQCTSIQGFLTGKPMPIKDCEDLIVSEKKAAKET